MKLRADDPSWRAWAGGAILAAGTVAIYSRTFSVPLLFDDIPSIRENPSIRHGLWPLGPILTPPKGLVSGRPLVNLSYALNYTLGGYGLFGYHCFNLAVHVLAALVLFGLLRRTLRCPALAPRFGAAATPLALAASAFWAWHPVQTQSVTYLSQRAESLMGLFYLATLYCFVRGAETDGRAARRAWFSLSVLACLAGVGSKEVIVTAPILAFLYDRTFISGSFAAAWRRHRPVFLALAATWIPLGWLMIGMSHRGVGFGLHVSWWSYAITECRVVVRYLFLVFWPHPLVFDYGLYAPPRLAEIWPYLPAIFALLAATLLALRRWPAIGFAACWFFLILAPVSSVIPVVGAPMAENRLYLPLAGPVTLALLCAYTWIGRWSLRAAIALAAGLGAASFQRNRDYSSELAIWSDTAAKCPDNARAGSTLGAILGKMPGRLDEGIAQLETTIRLHPDYAEARCNLGDALSNLPNRLNEAAAQLEEALRLDPDSVAGHMNLGNVLLKMPGRSGDAIVHFEAAIREEPESPEIHNNLGIALSRVDRWSEALAEFNEAVRLDPGYGEAFYNLGSACLHLGRPADAIASLEQARRLLPGKSDCAYSLGVALTRAGHPEQAIPVYEEALRLNPSLAEAHNDLGTALASTGRMEEAIVHFRQAVSLDPGFYAARLNLDRALMLTGQTGFH